MGFIRFMTVCSVIFFGLSGCHKLRPPRTSPKAIYTVKTGDSLSVISERYNISMKELRRLNSLDESARIYPGDKLKLPIDYLSRTSEQVGKRELREILGDARVQVGKLQWPLPEQAKINSKFGKRWSSFHEGIDLKGSVGTPVYAAHDGEVVYSGRKMSGYGNMVVVQSGEFMTAYAHNRKNLVKVGQRVSRGQTIAELGMTGRVTGPHLHFETRVKNSKGKYVAVNPLLFFDMVEIQKTLL